MQKLKFTKDLTVAVFRTIVDSGAWDEARGCLECGLGPQRQPQAWNANDGMARGVRNGPRVFHCSFCSLLYNLLIHCCVWLLI